MELKLRLITRAQMKKLKVSNGNEDNGMVAYMEKALKNKFEGFGDQGEASKLFSICSISKDHSRKQLEGKNWLSVLEGQPTVNCSLPLLSPVRFWPKRAEEFMPYHRRWVENQQGLETVSPILHTLRRTYVPKQNQV
ncbi:hypothetical protein M9H77_30084 [Catharanthus roseus]|uniref:Uncharacterized protein n=1 Tax=Catharanthus roseus TaxID=4058 RepID=A0ACB9ZXK1_CATRO|nr:hypothetical protein M9H77_30084 [Catharanthus roseus]